MTLALESPTTSHRWRHPGDRMLAHLAWAAGATTASSCLAALAVLIVCTGLAALARVDELRIARRLLAVLPFVGLLLLPMLWERRWESAFLFVIQSLAAALAAMSLFMSTTLGDLLTAARRWGIPARLLQLILLAERYAFLLADEWSQARLAWQTRGFVLGWSRRSYRVAGVAIGAMTARSLMRADRVGQALACRGFDGAFRTLPASTPGEWLPKVVALAAMLFALIQLGLPS